MRAAAPTSAAADGLAQARARRDARAKLADRSRQCRDQRDDGDRHHDARLAVAARARRRRARIQPLPAPIPAWRRHRLGALPDRRREGRGRRRRGSVAPRDPPGASLRAHHCARHLAGPVAHLEHPQGDRRRARSRRRRRNLYARVPVEPRAQPALLCRARSFFCPRASPTRPDRRPRGRRVQRARQLRAHLRQAGGAGARHFWLGARDHAFPDADGAPALRGLAPRSSACAACGCSRSPGGRRRASSWPYGGLACRSERRSRPRSASFLHRLCSWA